MDVEERESYKHDIIEYLSECTLRERLEILANVFIYYGVSEMLDQHEIEEEALQVGQVANVVIDHIRDNGNTLGNSLAMQGITILAWLHQDVE